MGKVRAYGLAAVLGLFSGMVGGVTLWASGAARTRKAAPAAASVARSGLEEAHGRLSLLDLDRDLMVLELGGRRVTMKADAATTVFSHGQTGTVLDLQQGQALRVLYEPGERTALWVEPDGPAPSGPRVTARP